MALSRATTVADISLCDAPFPSFLPSPRLSAATSMDKEDDTFTLRKRDSMAQKRTTEAELFALLDEQVY